MKNKPRLHLVLGVCSSMCVAGCASMFSTETQPVKINATYNNHPETNVTCTIQNGRGSWTANAGESTVIRRDSRPLTVTCNNKDNTLMGSTSINSYYNTTNLWNIPLTLIPVAGIAGWVLDGTNGTANEYPGMVNIQMSNSHK